MVYGSKTVITVKIGITSARVVAFDGNSNQEELRTNLYLPEEKQSQDNIREAGYKEMMAKYYNNCIKNTQFQVEDLILRKNEVVEHTKLANLKPDGKACFK